MVTSEAIVRTSRYSVCARTGRQMSAALTGVVMTGSETELGLIRVRHDTHIRPDRITPRLVP